MGKRYLIDSNTIIDFFNGSMPLNGRELILNIQPIISIVTYVEMFSSRHTSLEEITKLHLFSASATVIQTDFTIAQKAIDLRLKYKTKFADAIIAATAISDDLILITRNMKDFQRISELNVINPYTI